MSSLKLFKNSRFINGCTGAILYNPVLVMEERLSVTLILDPSSVNITVPEGNDLISIPFTGDDGALPNNSLFCFGGQFCSPVLQFDTNNDKLYILVPYGTFPEHGSNLVLSKYINNYDYPVFFDVSDSTNNIINNVIVTNYSHERKQKTFGFHNTTFDVRDIYTASLVIPSNTEIYKTEQMLHSKYVAFISDNIEPINEVIQSGFVFDKPLGGGSYSPIARIITLQETKLKYPQKSGQKIINVIFNG